MEFSPKSMTQKKLLILYALSHLNLPMTEEQLIIMTNENEWMDFFELKQCLTELIQASNINSITIGSAKCLELSKNGRETLDMFIHKLPALLIEQVDDFAYRHRDEFSRQINLTETYEKKTDGTYLVTCRAFELKHEIFSISLEVENTKQAKKVCENWKSNSSDIYEFIIKKLL